MSLLCYYSSVFGNGSFFSVYGYLRVLKLGCRRYYDLKITAVLDIDIFRGNVGVCVLRLVGLILEAPAPNSVTVVYAADYPVVASAVTVGVTEGLALALAPVVRICRHIRIGIGNINVGEFVKRRANVQRHGVDRGVSDRLIEPRLGDSADTFAASSISRRNDISRSSAA